MKKFYVLFGVLFALLIFPQVGNVGNATKQEKRFEKISVQDAPVSFILVSKVRAAVLKFKHQSPYPFTRKVNQDGKHRLSAFKFHENKARFLIASSHHKKQTKYLLFGRHTFK